VLMTYCLGGLGDPVIGRWNWAVRSHSGLNPKDMSGGALVCAIAPRPTKSGIARPHQNLGGGPGNFARIAPKKRPIIVKFYTLVEFIEAHILVI
jgi:hypothetical protein